MKVLPCKMRYFSKLLVENSTASTELDLNQRHQDYFQMFISHNSPPLYQLRYQWNLCYEYARARTEMKLLPFKICYFFKLLAQKSTAATELDLNQEVKDYYEISISYCSPLLYLLSYQWNPSVEMTLFRYKICYVSKLFKQYCMHPLNRI